MFLGRSWFGKREFPWRKLLFPRLVIAGLETMRSFVWVVAGLKTLRSLVWVIAGLKTLRSFVWVIAGLKTLRSFIWVIAGLKTLRSFVWVIAGLRWTGALGLGETKTQVVVREDLSQTLIFQLELSP